MRPSRARRAVVKEAKSEDQKEKGRGPKGKKGAKPEDQDENKLAAPSTGKDTSKIKRATRTRGKPEDQKDDRKGDALVKPKAEVSPKTKKAPAKRGKSNNKKEKSDNDVHAPVELEPKKGPKGKKAAENVTQTEDKQETITADVPAEVDEVAPAKTEEGSEKPTLPDVQVEKTEVDTSSEAKESPELKKTPKKRMRLDDKDKNGVHVFLGVKDYPRWLLIKQKSGCRTNVEVMRWLLTMAEKYFGIYPKEDIKADNKHDPGLAGDSTSLMVADSKADGIPISDIREDQALGLQSMVKGTPSVNPFFTPSVTPKPKKKETPKPMSEIKADESSMTEETKETVDDEYVESSSPKEEKAPTKKLSPRLTQQKQQMDKAVGKPNTTKSAKGPQKRKNEDSQATPTKKKAVDHPEEQAVENIAEKNVEEGMESEFGADSKLSRCTVRLSSIDKEELTKIGSPEAKKAPLSDSAELNEMETLTPDTKNAPSSRTEETTKPITPEVKKSPPSKAEPRKIPKSKKGMSPRELRALARAKVAAKAAKVHRCNICSKTFSNNANLKRHCQLHSSIRFPCENCEKTFKSSAQLWAHRQRKHVERFECKECPKKFGLASLLAKHEKTHSKEKPFECKECQKCFASLQMLNDHAECHNSEEPYLCHLCGMAFKRRDVLNHHVTNSHESKEMFKCELCGKTYKHRESFSNHMEYHKNSAEGTSPYTCPICNKMFKTNKGLKGHVTRHNKNETFQCEVCEKQFSCNHHLQRHKVVHSETKPYHCPECNRGFTQISNMETHRRIHSGEKPYVCDLCGEAFRQNVGLKSHKKKVHDINVWKEQTNTSSLGTPSGVTTSEVKIKKPRKKSGLPSKAKLKAQSQIRLPAPLTVQRVPPLEEKQDQQPAGAPGSAPSIESRKELPELVHSQVDQNIDHQEKANENNQTSESVQNTQQNQQPECQTEPIPQQQTDDQRPLGNQQSEASSEQQPQQHPLPDPMTSPHPPAIEQFHHPHPIQRQLNDYHQPQAETQQQQLPPPTQVDLHHRQEQPPQEPQSQQPVPTIELQRPSHIHQQLQAPRPPEDSSVQQYQQSKEPQQQQHQEDGNKANGDGQVASHPQQQSYQQENYNKTNQLYQPQQLQHQQPQPLQYQQQPLQHQQYQVKEYASVQGRNNGPFPPEIMSYQRESITTSNFYSHYMQSTKISSGWPSLPPPPPTQPINPPPPLNRNDAPTSHPMPMPLMQNNSATSHRSTPGANTHHHLQALLDMESNLGNNDTPNRQAPISSIGGTLQSPPPTPSQHSRSSPSPSPHESSRPPSKGPQYQSLFHSPQASPLSTNFPSNHLNLRPPMNNTIPSNYPIPSPRPLNPFYPPTGASYQGATRDMISSQTQEPDHGHSASSLRQWYMGPPDTSNQQAALALAGMHYPAPMGTQPQSRMPYMGYSNAPMPFPLSGNPTPPSQQRWGH